MNSQILSLGIYLFIYLFIHLFKSNIYTGRPNSSKAGLTLSHPRGVSLWRVKSSGVRQSEIY